MMIFDGDTYVYMNFGDISNGLNKEREREKINKYNNNNKFDQVVSPTRQLLMHNNVEGKNIISALLSTTTTTKCQIMMTTTKKCAQSIYIYTYTRTFSLSLSLS